MRLRLLVLFSLCTDISARTPAVGTVRRREGCDRGKRLWRDWAVAASDLFDLRFLLKSLAKL